MGHLEYSSPECLSLRDCRRLRPRRRPHPAERARGPRRERARLLPQKQHRPPHRRDLRLPRELPHEARACSSTRTFSARCSPSSPRARFSPARAASARRTRWRSSSSVRRRNGPGRFPDQPAGGPHRERHLPVGAVQPRHHQCPRRATGRLPQIPAAASAHRRFQHEPLCHRPESRHDLAASSRCWKSGNLPQDVILQDAVLATREISREGAGARTGAPGGWPHAGRARHPARVPRPRDSSTWAAGTRRRIGCWKTGPSPSTRSATSRSCSSGGVDWISKKWLLEMFREKRGPHLAGSVAAKPRPGIPQHRPRQGALLRLEAGEAHRRIQRQRAAARSDAHPAAIPARAAAAKRWISFKRSGCHT